MTYAGHSRACAVAEPMSMLLFGTGLLVLGGTLRRRHRRADARLKTTAARKRHAQA
jgi:hypothetical protein